VTGGWWVHNLVQAGMIVELVSWIFWVILSITLHELAHGWAALWQGDDTPRRLNRLTANPLVHMGQWSLIFFAIVGIAWGVMPVDPSRFRWGRQGRVIVSGAGPAMNLVIAFVALTALGVWLAFGPSGTQLFTGGWLNIVLALFNLLPIPPLDGSSILSGLSFRVYRFYQQPNAQMIGMFVVIVIILTGCGHFVFDERRKLGAVYAGVITQLLGGAPPP
jgi:Zn-dependent protease